MKSFSKLRRNRESVVILRHALRIIEGHYKKALHDKFFGLARQCARSKRDIQKMIHDCTSKSV